MTKFARRCGLAGLLGVFCASAPVEAGVLFDIGSNNSPEIVVDGSGDAAAATGNRLVVGAGFGSEAAEGAGTLFDAVFDVNDTLPTVAFELVNSGDSQVFNFGSVTLGELSIGRNEVDGLTVAAFLNFVAPAGVSEIGSTVFAVLGTVNGDATSDFQITFESVNVDLGGGVSYNIKFSDINLSEVGTQNIDARVTLSIDPSFEGPVVPEPTSLAVLGSGVLGLLGYGIRRRKSAA